MKNLRSVSYTLKDGIGDTKVKVVDKSKESEIGSNAVIFGVKGQSLRVIIPYSSVSSITLWFD